MSCQIEPIRFTLEFISNTNAVHNFMPRNLAKTRRLTYIYMCRCLLVSDSASHLEAFQVATRKLMLVMMYTL